MADVGIEQLKEDIQDNIKTNNSQAITGAVLQGQLIDTVDTLKGYTDDHVSVSQNTLTGHTEINIGDSVNPIPSIGEIISLGKEQKGLLIVDGGLFASYITTSVNYKRTQPIQVQAGDFISVKSPSYAQYYYIIATCDYDGENITNYNPVVPFKVGDGIKEYDYLVEKDGYLLISVKTDSLTDSSIRIKRDFLSDVAKSITQEKYDNHLSKSNANRLNAVINTYYINNLPFDGFITSTGNIQANSNFKSSDYIAVESGQKYEYCGNVYGDARSVAFYDVNKKFISDSSSVLASRQIFTVPENAYYLRFSSQTQQTMYVRLLSNNLENLSKGMLNLKHIPFLAQRIKLPTISLVFDDCIDGDEDAYNICKENDIRCSFAFIASDENLANKKDKYLRYQNDGFSILSHSVDDNIFNPTNYPTAADAFDALYLSRKRLLDAGFVVNGFVAPNSTFVSDYIPQIEKVYNYAFTGLGDSSVKYNSRKCNLSRYSMEEMALDDGTYNCLKGRITIAKTFGYNMTFYAHMRNVAETGTGANEWSYEKLRAFIAYLVAERDAGKIFIGNTDECMKNYFDSERMLQDGWVGGKHLIFNNDNTITWSND